MYAHACTAAARIRMDDALLRVTVLQCIEYSIGHAVVLYTVQHYMKTE